MLSAYWAFPLVVAALAIYPLYRAVLRLRAEERALRVSVAALAEVRPQLAAVRQELSALASSAGRSLGDLGRR